MERSENEIKELYSIQEKSLKGVRALMNENTALSDRDCFLIRLGHVKLSRI
jgi:hypothetical protein